MSSQGMTRKRPAPGTAPAGHPQMGAVPNYQPSNPNSQLSNDQFLQWGQNPSTNTVNPSSYADPSTYIPASYTGNQDSSGSNGGTSNQLTRRQQPNQLVSRNRGYEQSPATYPDQNSGQNPGEGAWGESLEELYQRALTAKREAQAKRKQIPPFVQKLSSFLDESKNTELIRWSDDGNSFIVLDEDEFARTLIPELFKHNNYASFVRQLNMYGFHKKVGLSDNSMRASERKNKSPSEYANPYFKRGHPDLLWLISKPKNAAGHSSKGSKSGPRVKTEDADENEMEDYGDEGIATSRDERARPRQLSLLTDTSMQKDQLSGVYRELQAIRQQQQIISNTITRLRKEHEQLYAQAANFQEQHTRHENSINAILTFLATVYNRSLQGQEGTQNLANSFAGAISGDQGNIVDMGDDFSFNPLANMSSPTGQRTMKKQPLLLKAPPSTDDSNRATTLSPAASGHYDTRSRGHTRQPSATQHGHVEEVLDSSPRQESMNVSSGQQTDDSFPQRDIMSVIQNSNARNGVPTSFSEFPNVLSSLETSGGNVPLTPNQRADMLRLMANETGDPSGSAASNSALVTPHPPPMPHNYSGRLANTRQEIDNLVKMQAEQDRSVQNLTNLLQPLSPTGAIPGLDSDGNVPPPPLDLDQIFNNDYFTDLGDSHHDDKKPVVDDHSGHGPGSGTTNHDNIGATQLDDGDTNDLFDFDHIPADGDLFDSSNQGQDHSAYNYGFDGSGYGADSGRIVEQLTDSEATSPAAVDEPDDGGSAKRRKRA
ncbi:Heat shock factor (HSF)-type DNA-binding [Penicillium macrosclerotiorum]|uniref:Heat shock factor (HSF)-type DNA-binding n=1 Tax=Penicillium macrosclerotiorum TaxID=303699 RepID=UPI002549419D|nr:Heat shock factor (HSF)-type DNA-binding [Penicillium macrosclerotiorum]KAJ5688821.1 Heat shock factor (HSF)-type DNA-binding [Penicillium macrosclerotiorum]